MARSLLMMMNDEMVTLPPNFGKKVGVRAWRHNSKRID
jgi:hypothetical protein